MTVFQIEIEVIYVRQAQEIIRDRFRGQLEQQFTDTFYSTCSSEELSEEHSKWMEEMQEIMEVFDEAGVRYSYCWTTE